jgi:hypothetical protein
MSMRGLGSLSDLAKIIEAASNPESELREDRQRPKKGGSHRKVEMKRVVDPKRKAWHEKRLREQQQKAVTLASDQKAAVVAATPVVDTKLTKTVAVGLSGSLMKTLAAAKDAKPKVDEKNKKKEAWRRKPGDPVF